MKKKRKNNNVKAVLTILLVALLIAGAVYFMYAFLQVEELEIVGNSKFEKTYIENLAAIEEKTHMFFLKDEVIKENIEKEPFVEVLKIKKSYPNKVIITIKEREPKALVKYADEFLLVDDIANMLAILRETPEENYPVVEGFNISAVTLGKPLATEDTFKVSVLNDIIKELYTKDLNVAISNIDLGDINNIKMKTRDGYTIKFGQSDKISDKAKWIKKMFVQLEKEGKKEGTIDISSGTMGTYKPSDAQIDQNQDAQSSQVPVIDDPQATPPTSEATSEPAVNSTSPEVEDENEE